MAIPQLKTIAILALDDAIIRLTQAKTSLTMAQTSLTMAQTNLTKAKDTSSQEASQTASSQAALPKGSPMADMEEVEDSAEPGTTE